MNNERRMRPHSGWASDRTESFSCAPIGTQCGKIFVSALVKRRNSDAALYCDNSSSASQGISRAVQTVSYMLFQLGVVQALDDFAGKWMSELADGTCVIVGIEFGANSVFVVEFSFAGLIDNPVVDIGGLAPGTHADQHALCGVAGTPAGHFPG